MIFDIHTHKIKPNSIYSPLKFDESLQNATYLSLGIHPWRIDELNEIEKEFESLLLHFQTYQNKVLAIGETGLDLTIKTPIEKQITLFKKHIQLSEEKQLPLVIHCVKAFHHLQKIKKELKPKQAWIIHDFRKNSELANQLCEQDFYLSLSPNILKVNPNEIKKYPSQNIFFETDESAIDINESFSFFATSKQIDKKILIKQVNKNIEKIFVLKNG